MKHEFKPGDLALIVGADTDIANIGKVCELVELIPPLGKSSALLPSGRPARHEYEVAVWLLAGPSLTQKHPANNGFAVREECHLIPLRGDENPDAHRVTSTPRQAVPA